MKTLHAGLAFGAGFFLLSAATAAPKAEPLFVCEASCRIVSHAMASHPQLRPLATYPSDLRDAGVEGFVKLAYDVQPDGHASNIVVMTRLGPPAFSDASIGALKEEVFAPARDDGVPVLSRGLLRVDAFDIGQPPAHAAFAAEYARAQKLIAEDKAAEAITAMKAVLNLPAVSLYEAAGAEDLLAVAYLQLRDGEHALQAINEAEVLALNSSVSDALKHAIHRAHVAAAEMTHHYREALDLRAPLTVPDGLLPADEETFARLQAIVDGGTPFTVHGTVPDDGTTLWTYDLAHAAFSIANVGGALSRYDVYCANTSHESPSGGPAQARLPPGWSKCRLIVFGTPGTTFDITDG